MKNLKINSIELKNGFKIIGYENENYKDTYINFSIKYGAKDFTYLKNKKMINHPPGIAHYLEHVMFNTKQGDAFTLFDNNHASANAYTSYDKTSYIFSTSTDDMKNLDILLNMVTNFEITKENVIKENSIITEEISMYEKNYDYKIYMETLKNALVNSKYNKDILGEKKDIDEINLKVLNEVYNDFYTPNNSYIIIVGRNIEKLINYVSEFMESKKHNLDNIEKISAKEKHKNINKKIKIKNINNEYNSISFKYLIDNENLNLSRLYLELYLESKFSTINIEYEKALKDGEINSSFEYDFIVEKDYIMINFFFLDLEVYKTEKIIKRILEYQKIGEIKFKNYKIGKAYKKIENTRNFCEFLVSLENKNIDFKNYISLIDEISVENMEKFITKLLKENSSNIKVSLIS